MAIETVAVANGQDTPSMILATINGRGKSQDEYHIGRWLYEKANVDEKFVPDSCALSLSLPLSRST